MSEIPDACAEFDPDLSALLDGELCERRERELREHAESCERCATRLQALRRVDGLLAGVPMPPIPSDLRARLEARIASEASEPARRTRSLRRLQPRPRRARWLAGLAAAAAAALALYLGALPDGAPPGPMRVEVAESTPAEAAEASPAAGEVAESAPPTAPIEVAEASPAVAESPPAPPDLDTASDEELALVLEIETIEDLGAIANLDLLERILLMEEGAG